MRNITKKDFVVELAARTRIPERQVKEIVEMFMGEIIACLVAHKTIELRGFGTFSVQPRKGRPACNPRTGKTVIIPERFSPILRFSPSVRERVNDRQKGAV